MSGELVGAIAAALVLFWWVGAYNRLVRLRSRALQAFGALTAQLRRRHALAEAGAAPRPESSDPSRRSGPMFEATTALRAAAQQFGASLAAAQARPLDATAMRSLGAANAVLLLAWQRRVADEEDPADGALQVVEWSAIAAQLAHANAEFEQAASSYNTAIHQFPAQIVAAVFGLRLAGRFEG